MTKNPTIREKENGDVVIDFGSKWFVCHTDGRVTTKIAKDGKVERRDATSGERLIALGHAAFDHATLTK